MLLGRTVSEGAERYMVSELKAECGGLFTTKLEAMFKDMSSSSAIAQEFAAFMGASISDNHGIDMNVAVLTTGVWPIPAATQQSIVLAAPLGAFEMFRRLYLATHDGRKLTLQTQLGWADMSATVYGRHEQST